MLQDLYWGEEMSLTEVSRYFSPEGEDPSPQAIQYWMEKHGIDRRDPHEATKGNPDIYKEGPDHPASIVDGVKEAEEILGEDPTDLSQSEVAEYFFEHDELAIRFSGCGMDAYYIVDTDDPTLHRGSTSPTSVTLDSGYVQSLFDQYEGQLVHESAVIGDDNE